MMCDSCGDAGKGAGFIQGGSREARLYPQIDLGLGVTEEGRERVLARRRDGGWPHSSFERFTCFAMGSSELGCTYASLILHDEEIPMTVEKINTLLNAANVTVEVFWSSLFAKLAHKGNIEDHVLNAGSGGGGGVAVAATASGAATGGATEAAPAKEEPKEESDDDMGFSLFD